MVLQKQGPLVAGSESFVFFVFGTRYQCVKDVTLAFKLYDLESIQPMLYDLVGIHYDAALVPLPDLSLESRLGFIGWDKIVEAG